MTDEHPLGFEETRLAETRSEFDEPDGEVTRGDAVWCGSCGARNPPGAQYCGTCGTIVDRKAAPRRPYADPLVGMLVGHRYRILERIGSGGMGAVYRIRHEQIGKEAAMKLLHGDLARDSAMVRRFYREARAVSRLNDPHTVSVFDFGQSGGLVYLVMELLQGRDLGRVLREEGALSPRRVARIIGQVASALTEAHDLGIVHRDLKPQNVFLCPHDGGETAKVLDFGLAKLVAERDDSMALTQDGTVMGTPYYMSPEQIEDTAVDQRSDQYSLAALTFRLLVNRPPYEHPSPLGVLHRHLHDPVPRVSSVDPSLAALDDVVGQAMAKAPEGRYRSVRAFSDALTQAVHAMTDRSTAPTLVPRPVSDMVPTPGRIGTREEFEVFERNMRARRLFNAGVSALLAGSVLAGVVWLATRGSRWVPARENEPNDSVETASELHKRVVSARISPPHTDGTQDIDRFAFAPSGGDDGERWLVRAQPEEALALRVHVHNAEGRAIASYSASAGAPIFVDGIRADSGRVTVSVRSANGADGRYTLAATSRAAYVGEEAEPNDEVASAGQLLDNVPRVGLLAWPDDVDVFRLPSGDGGTYRFELDPIAGADLRLRVFDEQGTEVAVLDERGVGGAESGRFTVDPTQVVGVPLISVEADGDFARHLAYELRVRRMTPGEAREADL